MTFEHVGRYSRIQPGSLLRAKSPGLRVDHWGIAGRSLDDGTPTVVHNTLAGVQVTCWEQFAAGRPVEVIWAPESPQQQAAALHRAYSQIGQPYNLFRANCEHFATWVVTGVPQSPQLRTYCGAALLALLPLVVCTLGRD